MTDLNPMASKVPLEASGILLRDNFESELDEQIDQINRIGYVVIDSGYSKEKIGIHILIMFYLFFNIINNQKNRFLLISKR